MGEISVYCCRGSEVRYETKCTINYRLLARITILWYNRHNMNEKEIGSPKQEETKYNKSAIVGLALSVIAIFGVGLAGIAGFILGIVALAQIKHTHEKGKWIAIAAIVVGFIWSFVVGILKRLVEAGF